MIPQTFIQELLARVDILDVIERHVRLKKAGANYAACCPFHNEKTPSFTVSPAKQFYHCFGCGAHGSALGFLMEYTGLGFVDAVHELAALVGMQVPQQARETGPTRTETAPLTEVMARAARYYREQLKASPKAVAYLKGRGLTGEIAARFGLGYAPEGWQPLAQVLGNYADPALVQAGLVIEGEAGKRYDRFRDRVMFPILDTRNNVIGFGGRVLGEGEPKYLNSPETPLFEKGRELYGLPQARKAIHDEGFVIVVEGYMDVIGLAQQGIENVVATLGTAATDTNVQRLLKSANRVVFCFDRDAAGDRAAWRAMEVSLPHIADNKTVEILQMPGSQDPDEFVREHGRDAFLGHARSATRLSEFMLRELSRKAVPNTVEGRALLVHLAKPLLQKVAAPILRGQLTRALADAAHMDFRELQAACDLRPLAIPARNAATAPNRARARPSAATRKLLRTVLFRPAWAGRIPAGLLVGEDAETAALLAVLDAVDSGSLGHDNLNVVFERFRGSEHEAVLGAVMGELMGGLLDESEAEALFEASIARLRLDALERDIKTLEAQAAEAKRLSPDDRARYTRLLAEKQRLKTGFRDSAG